MRRRFNNGLQHMAGFSHVAFCSGPAQLAFLLAALEVCGIPPRRCTIQPYPGSAKNDDLKKTLVKACALIGMQTVDADLLPAFTVSDVFRMRASVLTESRLAFWYCQGRPFVAQLIYHFRKTMPDYVIEYYDGLGSHIAALEQEKMRLSVSDAHGVSDLRQLAVQRLMRPDMHLMPEDGLWQKYAPPHSQARTRYVSSSVMLRNIRLVGEILDDISGDRWPLGKGPDIILLPPRFSELRHRGGSEVANELGMDDDLLGMVRSVSRTASILVKTHPRTGAEITHRLEEICAKHDARLYNRQQLVEYILDRSWRRDVAVIGCWSTALLNTVLFGWGRSFCLSKCFIASYIGHEYADDPRMTGDHELMEFSGVNMVNSLQELGDMLREKKIP